DLGHGRGRRRRGLDPRLADGTPAAATGRPEQAGGVRPRALVVSVGIAMILGVPLGVLAGYLGGRVDAVIMRFVDILLAFPSLILALIAVFALGPGLTNAMIGVGIS